MISPHGIARLLLQYRLLTPEEIAHSGVTIENISGRNHTFRVVRNRGASYILKQGVGAERVATVKREALVYSKLGTSLVSGFRHYLPRFHRYDPNRHVLIIEFMRGSDLRSCYIARRRLSTKTAVELGTALAALHRARHINRIPRYDLSSFARKPPWILSAHRPGLESLRKLSAGEIEVTKVIQNFEEFSEHLDRLQQDWRSETFIHGDLRWGNCIVAASARSGSKTTLKIVDWEFAGFGDRSWDVGSVFAEYLSFWLELVPLTGDASPDRYLHLAEVPLEQMQPALGSFWSTYGRQMALSRSASDEELLRAVQYSAARLLQKAFEEMQASTQLTAYAVCLLQLSLNMLRRSKDAAAELLGLPVRG
jgi:thiamine kinase-like enzyme